MAKTATFDFQDDEIYPVEASRGGNNAFYKACDVVGHSPAYCICVNKVHAYDRGDRNFWPECITAINNNRCGAVSMLSDEQEKGVAVYFINRTKLQAFNQRREEAGNELFQPREPVVSRPIFESAHVKAMFDKPEPAKSVPVVSKRSVSVLDKIDDAGYGAAINRAIESAPMAAVIAGESMLDMARRMMGK